MDFGRAIRAKRKERRMTQIELAQAAGIAVNSLRLYESGKRQPKQSVFIDIAHALGTNAAELMGFSPTAASRLSEKYVCDMHGIISDDIDLGLVVLDIADRCGISNEIAERAMKVTLANFSDFLRTSEDEIMIKNFLDELNEQGKQIAVERVQELTEIPRYQKQTTQDDE